jgi:hypothetical protein
MTILQKQTNYLLAFVLLVAAIISGGAFTASKVAQKRQPSPMQHVTDTLPPVISKIPSLKVLSATITGQGQPDPMAAIEIWNDSDIGVTGVTLTAGDISSGIEGGLSSDVPLIVIEPHGTTVVGFTLNSLEKDVPIFVAGAIYADNHEEGEDIVLEVMHKQRDKKSRYCRCPDRLHLLDILNQNHTKRERRLWRESIRGWLY